MDKKTIKLLAELIQKIVRSEIKNTVPKIIKEEMDNLIMESTTVANVPSINTILDEQEVFQKPVQRERTKKNYSSNPVLNQMLNETASDHEHWPSDPEGGAVPDMAQTFTSKTAQFPGMRNPNFRAQGPSVDEIMSAPVNDHELRATSIDPDSKEALNKIFTRDYSELVKAMDKKK